MQIKVVGYTLLPLTVTERVLELEAMISRLRPEVFLSGLKTEDAETTKPVVSPVDQHNYLMREIESEIARQEDRRHQWQATLNSDMPDGRTRSHGSVHLISDDKSENLHVHFDEWTLAPSQLEKRMGNSVSIEKEFQESGLRADEMVRGVCQKFFDGSLFDYGFCCTVEEFQSKNIDRSGGGQRAIGLDASKYLPGFFWGNFFSDRLQGRMPLVQERINGFVPLNLSNGLLLLGADLPWHWSNPKYMADANAAINTIGEQFFFNTNATRREELFTVAD